MLRVIDVLQLAMMEATEVYCEEFLSNLNGSSKFLEFRNYLRWGVSAMVVSNFRLAWGHLQV